MSAPGSIRLAAQALLIVNLVTACGAATDAPPTPPPLTATPATLPTAAATPVSATHAPTASPSVEPPSPEPPMAEPPAASIAVEGGDPVIGDLGTFSWENGASDAPWLDGTPIRIGAREQLFMTLAEPVALDAWTVSRAAPGGRDGIGALSVAEDRGGVVTFQAPPVGTWSVQISVWFAGGLGSAAYYWLVTVE